MIDTANVNVNLRHPFGWTALMVGAINDRAEVCQYLLEAGADPNMSDEYINSNRTAHEHGLFPLEGKIKLPISFTY